MATKKAAEEVEPSDVSEKAAQKAPPSKSSHVEVSVATPGRKKWTVAITGVGPEIPDIKGVIADLRAGGHSVEYARTTNETGSHVVDHLAHPK